MRATPKTALAILMLCAVAACAPPGRTITADQLPHVKPGLWVEAVTDNGTAMGASQDCSDGALHLPGALMPAGCTSQPVMRLTPNGAVVVDWSCSAGGVTTMVHTSAAGDFGASYLIDSKTTMTASGAAPQITTVHEAYKFLGPCPAGAAGAQASGAAD
ncbi:MAG TPA: hypothetical protein VN805_12335 [Caulobacteraceae bacterium]|nr:hypothetical protein [Caulobacteraceae bacterium]